MKFISYRKFDRTSAMGYKYSYLTPVRILVNDSRATYQFGPEYRLHRMDRNFIPLNKLPVIILIRKARADNALRPGSKPLEHSPRC